MKEFQISNLKSEISKPRFENVKGFALTPDPKRSTWRKTIYEYQANPMTPLTYIDADEVEYRPDNHYFTDQGSVPRIAQLVIPKDRFLGFYFHDSGYIHGGLYVRFPRSPVFIFRHMFRRQVDDLLHDMVLADPCPGWKLTADAIWGTVRIGGAFCEYGAGDQKFRSKHGTI